MRLTTNIPGNPELRFRRTRGEAGLPTITVTCANQAWRQAWEAEPAISAVRLSDVEVGLFADGALLRMRGQTGDEHDWLAGWEDRRITVAVKGDEVTLAARIPAGSENETERMMTPTLPGAARQYDQMATADLITEAVRRGLGVYQMGPDGFYQGSGEGQPIPKHALVKMLREHDHARAMAGKNTQLVELEEPTPTPTPAPTPTPEPEPVKSYAGPPEADPEPPKDTPDSSPPPARRKRRKKKATPGVLASDPARQ